MMGDPVPQDETKPNGRAPGPTVIPRAVAAATFAAQANAFIALGVNSLVVTDALLDVAANLVAGIEPALTREQIVTNVRSGFRKLVDEQHRARNTTPGGIVIPR